MIPDRLKKGDTISVIAVSNTAKPDDIQYLEKSKKLFEDLGINVIFGKNICSNTLGYGATVQEKVEDLHDAFSNKDVKGIFIVKGGEDSNSLFDYIDYELIKENPKIICGFSDSTSVLNVINLKTNLVTYHGPTFKSLTSWETDYGFRCVIDSLINDSKSFGKIDEEYYTLKKGKADGELIGGNLSLISKMSAGKYKVNFKNKILFLEELGFESSPNLVSNNLYYMKQNGVFDDISGLWIGNYEHESNIKLEQIIMNVLKDGNYSFPIIKSDNFGHIDKKIVIPVGARASIDTEAKEKIKLI